MTMTNKQKVYQSVIKELQRYIEINQLNAGDKLPSERELSDKLNAGRSSIREALRALELIGLIETRHGEGTFLNSYQSFQTVELLSSFILTQNNIKHEIPWTKQIIEKEATKLAIEHLTESDIEELEKIDQLYREDDDLHHYFFSFLLKKTNNLLMDRIWMLLEEFSSTVPKHYYIDGFYPRLIKLIRDKDYGSIESIFSNPS
ncbi:FadR/GntR family transcriptional regulator [Oceanobacillus sp. 1P07AA]|uniref:FadR/GntR family transcriptional regulator n=1 Tax=Oceanobacillus sp. 1P07AA TaxID=3132293 RepID=UPI0039A62BF4